MTIKLPWGLRPFEDSDVTHIEVLLTIYAETSRQNARISASSAWIICTLT
jgi:hypothetical protein